MIQADKLSKSFLGKTLFENVCFTLNKGEKCALVGRNGSGKTTLFRILKGKESPDSGRVSYPKGYKMGFLDQHTTFHAETVWEEALRDLPPNEPEHVVKSLLYGLGFDELKLALAPEKLSGGYHLRLKLTKVLAARPDCLLLDEPTNYLDILSLRWLERYLKTWKGECLLISHDRDFLNGLVDSTMGLHRGRLKKVPGGLEGFYQQILQEEQVHEKTRQSLEKKKGHLEDYIRKFGAKASKASQAQSKAKALDKLPSLSKLTALFDLSFHFEYAPYFGKKLLSLQNVSFCYKEDAPLIQNISLEIKPGQKVAIIGKNGEGKSTLLQILSGNLKPSTGTYTSSEGAKIGTFGQTHLLKLDENATVEQEISKARADLTYGKVRALCGQMMFPQDEAKKKISLLSGGEKSRVLLGKILASPTNCLMLDEPTHHLDLESIEGLMQAIEEYKGAVVIVTHSPWVLEKLCPDQLIIFEGGTQKIFEGNYEEFLDKQGWQEEAPKHKRKKAPTSKTPTNKQRIEKQIQKLEGNIQEMDIECAHLEESLAKAYEQQETDSIDKIADALAKKRKTLEALYHTLEDKYSELENL